MRGLGRKQVSLEKKSEKSSQGIYANDCAHGLSFLLPGSLLGQRERARTSERAMRKYAEAPRRNVDFSLLSRVSILGNRHTDMLMTLLRGREERGRGRAGYFTRATSRRSLSSLKRPDPTISRIVPTLARESYVFGEQPVRCVSISGL